MTFESVPWAVGGGAEHSAEVARLFAHAATSGADGIVGAWDLRVVPLAVPGGSVRVMKGACLVPNRASGQDRQTYIGRNLSEEVVAVTATGSAGGRTDMIIVRVEDPWLAGEPWSPPVTAASGPYIFTRVLEGVPTSAVVDNQAAREYLAGLNYSAIPLAAVTLPASTGTVGAAEIKDLRAMALPRTRRDVFADALPFGVKLQSTSDTTWPGNGPTVKVPEWATHGSVVVSMPGLWVGFSYPISGYLHVAATADLTVRTPDTRFFAEGSPPMVVAGGMLTGVEKVAGDTVTFQLRGRDASTSGGYLMTPETTETLSVYDIQFYERPAL